MRHDNITVSVNDTLVVNCTEPEKPYRVDCYATGCLAFGTNNVDADFGKLEYCFEAVEACSLTASDIWFPSMSVRSTRRVG